MTTIEQARRELPEWAEGAHRAVLSLAEEWGVAPEMVERDPLCLIAHFDRFISGISFSDLDEDERDWLHSQIAAYVAEVLIGAHGGHWAVVEDASDPDGFKRVVTLTGRDGQQRTVDPFEIAYGELRNPPAEILRAVGDAESRAGVAPAPQ